MKLRRFDSSVFNTSKQWIKGNVINFICETKSVSKQHALIFIIFSSKNCNEPKPCFPSWLLSPVFMESVCDVFILKFLLWRIVCLGRMTSKKTNIGDYITQCRYLLYRVRWSGCNLFRRKNRSSMGNDWCKLCNKDIMRKEGKGCNEICSNQYLSPRGH